MSISTSPVKLPVFLSLFLLFVSMPVHSASSANKLDLFVCQKASYLPPFVLDALRRYEVDANVILPIILKCLKQEQKGVVVSDHLWIVVYVRTPFFNEEVKLVLSCSDSITGKYPLFLFAPTSYAEMANDPNLYSALRAAARLLRQSVSTRRIYSVFGRDILTRTFATIWQEETLIPPIVQPYYNCKISYLTRDAFERNMGEPPLPSQSFQIRPAQPMDVEGVARLCYNFSATSPPFELTPNGARAEAVQLIENNFVWVHTLASQGGRQRIVSIVAFTRNSDNVATVTKVFTDPRYRGARCAERLLRRVCEFLLYDCGKDKVALFVGIDNRAANVYQRVGFLGVGEGAAPAEGADVWVEMGFELPYVDLDHW